jgi:hypothetical protein
MERLRWRIAFHASTTAITNRIIKRRHNPRTTHAGNPATPQNANTAARTARMRIVTAHENISVELTA